MAPQLLAPIGNPANMAYGTANKKRKGCFEWDSTFWVGMLVEYIGTAGVVFFVWAARMLLYFLSANRECCAAGRVEASLAAAFAYALFAYYGGFLRGGHANPVVSLGFMIAQKITLVHMLLLWAAQLLGALTAGGMLSFLFSAYEATLGTPVPYAGFTDGRVVFLEALGTMFIVLALLCREKCGIVSGKIYGLAVGMVSFTLMQFTGASLNPFAQLGVAVWSGVWTSHWAYWVGTFVGAAIAAVVFILAIFTTRDEIIEWKRSEKSRN